MICYGRHAPRALAHSITMWSEKNQGKIYVNKTKKHTNTDIWETMTASGVVHVINVHPDLYEKSTL